MFDTAYKIGRIWGIPIKIHVSLLVVYGIMLLTTLGQESGGLGSMIQLAAFLFCLASSILLHELGHSFFALRNGDRVREISLTFIGGVAQMESIPRRPMDEFVMAIAGPAVSIVLGIGFILAGSHVSLPLSRWPLPFVYETYRCNVVTYVGIVNLGLAAFNLIPSFPMDGGRIFRAALTPKLGRLRATQVAARIGKIFAIVLGYRGFMGEDYFMVAIAFFVYTAASAELRMVMAETARRQGWQSPWGMFTSAMGAPPPPPPEPLDDEQVRISPPPYERGPDRKADIKPDRDDPFKGMFGR